MIFRSLLRFPPLGLLLLRLMIGNIFADSGWEDLRNAEQRSQSIGKSRSFTIFLGTDRNSGRGNRSPRDLAATRGIRTHSRDVGSDIRESLCLAHGILG